MRVNRTCWEQGKISQISVNGFLYDRLPKKFGSFHTAAIGSTCLQYTINTQNLNRKFKHPVELYN